LPGRSPGGRRQPSGGGVVPRLPRPRAERRSPAEAQWYDRRVIRGIVLLLITLAAAPVAAQQMYRWTDQNGRVHITDTPPPSGAKGVQKSRGSAAPAAAPEGNQQTPYDLALAMKDFPVALYTSPMCKEPCQRARDHLNKRGVPFREV